MMMMMPQALGVAGWVSSGMVCVVLLQVRVDVTNFNFMCAASPVECPCNLYTQASWNCVLAVLSTAEQWPITHE
jgi:hypothetical protein